MSSEPLDIDKTVQGHIKRVLEDAAGVAAVHAGRTRGVFIGGVIIHRPILALTNPKCGLQLVKMISNVARCARFQKIIIV